MDLKKQLGTMTRTTRETVRHPVDTGLKVVGRSIGLVRGTVVAVAGAVGRHRGADQSAAAPPIPSGPDREPRTQTPGDLPTPTDLAERVSPGDEVTTPVGTTGAGPAYNPDTGETDLQQPGTEPLMEPSTTKAVASEAETLRRGADTDKG